MKNEKGITLTALLIYVILFSATLALLATLSNYVYKNLGTTNADAISSEEFNKFNCYFVEDIKQSKEARIDNSSASVTVITLSNGINYTYKSDEKTIYRNKVKIAKNIKNFEGEVFIENEKNIVKITIGTGKGSGPDDFGITIKYVLKYW